MNWKLLLLLGIAWLPVGCNFELFKPNRDPFYSAMLAADRSNPAALFAQGRALLNQGRYREAEQLLEALVKIEPTHAAGWNALGRTRLETGKFAGAETAFRHQIALKTSEEGLLGLGAALLMQGQAEGAQSIATQVEQQFGKSAGLLRLQGDIAFRNRDYPQAQALYNESLKINPEQAGLTTRIRDLDDFMNN